MKAIPAKVDKRLCVITLGLHTEHNSSACYRVYFKHRALNCGDSLNAAVSEESAAALCVVIQCTHAQLQYLPRVWRHRRVWWRHRAGVSRRGCREGDAAGSLSGDCDQSASRTARSARACDTWMTLAGDMTDNTFSLTSVSKLVSKWVSKTWNIFFGWLIIAKILLLQQHNQHFYLDVSVSIRDLHQKKFVQFLFRLLPR